MSPNFTLHFATSEPQVHSWPQVLHFICKVWWEVEWDRVPHEKSNQLLGFRPESVSVKSS